uniref:Uncharacterized protein n=1 Tax=Oryza nivara TaxID=4536 RepID=A0A0E0HUC9_ORYNI
MRSGSAVMSPRDNHTYRNISIRFLQQQQWDVVGEQHDVADIRRRLLRGSLTTKVCAPPYLQVWWQKQDDGRW